MCSRGCVKWKRTQRGHSPPHTKDHRLSGWRNKDYLPPEAGLLSKLPCSIQSSNIQTCTGADWRGWVLGGGDGAVHILPCPLFDNEIKVRCYILCCCKTTALPFSIDQSPTGIDSTEALSYMFTHCGIALFLYCQLILYIILIVRTVNISVY